MMLSSAQYVSSPPAGQERKQGSESSMPPPPPPKSAKGSAVKALPLALHSFLGVVQNVATDGLNVSSKFQT